MSGGQSAIRGASDLIKVLPQPMFQAHICALPRELSASCEPSPVQRWIVGAPVVGYLVEEMRLVDQTLCADEQAC
jgi:hypothetical protein